VFSLLQPNDHHIPSKIAPHEASKSFRSFFEIVWSHSNRKTKL